MAHEIQSLTYSDGTQDYEATVVHPGGEGRPTVVVCHAWAGQSDYERDAATRLADLGYVGVAIDVYGAGKRGNTIEECQALMTPLAQDRALLQSRLQLGLDFARSLPGVSADKHGAIGFCFGGLCALDIARMGADVGGVVSFHGILGAPGNLDGVTPKAKVLALHGWDDPMATPDDVLAFSKEMTANGADWQLHAYGHAVHAFTNPAAASPDRGLVFNPVVRDRAWTACADFLLEVLG